MNCSIFFFFLCRFPEEWGIHDVVVSTPDTDPVDTDPTDTDPVDTDTPTTVSPAFVSAFENLADQASFSVLCFFAGVLCQ